MNTAHDPFDGPGYPALHAHAISAAVGAIRRAQCKRLPRDCEAGTAEWLSVLEEFAHDVARALDAMNDAT